MIQAVRLFLIRTESNCIRQPLKRERHCQFVMVGLGELVCPPTLHLERRPTAAEVNRPALNILSHPGAKNRKNLQIFLLMGNK